jgi:hypothetical protein
MTENHAGPRTSVRRNRVAAAACFTAALITVGVVGIQSAAADGSARNAAHRTAAAGHGAAARPAAAAAAVAAPGLGSAALVQSEDFFQQGLGPVGATITLSGRQGLSACSGEETMRDLTKGKATAYASVTWTFDTEGLLIDAYIPKDERYGLRLSGVEALLKYNFLKPALDPLGLSATFGFEHAWLDPHSGQDKDTYSFETGLQAQKFFREDQLVWLTNVAIEATIAKRAGIDDLPPGFEWPTEEEMEIEFTGATGLSYRFARNWFVGGEVLYQIERETEVGIERWSVQAGPSLHYGGRRWWATLTWLPQWVGGGERFAEQDDGNLHLIEKTKQEGRLRFGYNF